MPYTQIGSSLLRGRIAVLRRILKGEIFKIIWLIAILPRNRLILICLWSEIFYTNSEKLFVTPNITPTGACDLINKYMQSVEKRSDIIKL